MIFSILYIGIFYKQSKRAISTFGSTSRLQSYCRRK